MTLSTQQADEITRALDALAQRVRDELQQAAPQAAAETFHELAGEVHDSGEESVAATVEDTRHTLQQRHMRDLRDIDAARLRMADGNLGICIDCGQEIAYRRLLAYPTALRCVICQTQHEKTYGGERAPTL